MAELSEVFWVSFTTAVIGMILGLARMAYKSKCSHVNCGCISIDRNTDGELKEDSIELQAAKKSSEDDQPQDSPTVSGAFSDVNPMKQIRLFSP
jgi:hypothetical protein